MPIRHPRGPQRQPRQSIARRVASTSLVAGLVTTGAFLLSAPATMAATLPTVTACSDTSPALTVQVPAGGDIQAAIDQVRDAGGGCVDLAPGTWTLTTSLLLRTGVDLNGSGRDETILQGPDTVYDYPLLALTGPEPRANVTVENLLVNGRIPKSAVTTDPNDTDSNPYVNAYGITFSSFNTDDTNIAVKNVEVKHSAMGILLKGENGVLMENDLLHWNGIAFLEHDTYLRRVENAVVEDCIMDDSYNGTGLHVAGTSSNITIEGSQFDNDYGQGMHVQDTPTNVTIKDNEVNGNQEDGINATGNNLTIEGNTADNNGGDGIVTWGGVGGTISDNTALNNGGTNLAVHNRSTTVSDNLTQ